MENKTHLQSSTIYINSAQHLECRLEMAINRNTVTTTSTSLPMTHQLRESALLHRVCFHTLVEILNLFRRALFVNDRSKLGAHSVVVL